MPVSIPADAHAQKWWRHFFEKFRRNSQILKSRVSVSNFKSRSRSFWWSLGLDYNTVIEKFLLVPWNVNLVKWGNGTSVSWLSAWLQPFEEPTIFEFPIHHACTLLLDIYFPFRYVPWSDQFGHSATAPVVTNRFELHLEFGLIYSYCVITQNSVKHNQLSHKKSLDQRFPTCLGLRHPAEENYILRHPVANPILLQGLMTVWKCIFNSILKNASVAAPLGIVNGTLGCRGTPVGNHCTRCCSFFYMVVCCWCFITRMLL